MSRSGNSNEEIEWETRPGGMLVQKREDGVNDGIAGDSSSGSMIKINIIHGSSQHELLVPSQSTFGDVKKALVQNTGLASEEQRLFFRGKEKEDKEHLNEEGVRNKSKLLLLEDSASKERKLEEMEKRNQMLKASEAVAGVRAEVDKLSERVAALEVAMDGQTKVSEREFVVLSELLMRQLLKLDSIEAEGEAKLQRKAEVRRVQNVVDTVDTLKARNSNPFGSSSNAVSVTTKWETFDSGMGSLSPPPPMSSSTKFTQDWEPFD